jgi:hypothetical protein
MNNQTVPHDCYADVIHAVGDEIVRFGTPTVIIVAVVVIVVAICKALGKKWERKS